MFFMIPVGTDAPIYYWPFATVGLIVTNLACFVLTGFGNGPLMDAWVLEFANGLHPLQWVMANFVHFDIFHLVGNMVFLWAFGLVVEGKLGWWKYLLLYFGIGIAGEFLVQVVMLGYDGLSPGAGGASLVVYGLVAISLVWAPRNEVDLWYFFLFFFVVRVGVWEVSVFTLGMIYISMELLLAAFTGFEMSSAMLHLIGAVFGFGAGIALLKLAWVDCENWDLFAVMSNTHGKPPEIEYDSLGRIISSPSTGKKKKKRKYRPIDAPLDAEDVPLQGGGPRKSQRRFRELLDAGKPQAAVYELIAGQRISPEWELSEADLKALIDALYEKRFFDDAQPFLEEYVERFPFDCARMRLRLAAIYVQRDQRPKAALRVLRDIAKDELNDAEAARRAKIEEAANRMIDEGVIELGDRRR